MWQVSRDPTTGEILDISEVQNVTVTKTKVRQSFGSDGETELDEILNPLQSGYPNFESGNSHF